LQHASEPDVLKDYNSALDEKAEVKLHRDVREKLKLRAG
jgi:hypothetical protein